MKIEFIERKIIEVLSYNKIKVYYIKIIILRFNKVSKKIKNGNKIIHKVL
jgi:hypothetical protein